MKTSEIFFALGLGFLFVGPTTMELGSKFGLIISVLGAVSMATALIIQRAEQRGKKRIVHKMAYRDIDFWDKSKGKHYVQLCVAYSPYVAKNPILTNRWSEVTCERCHSGRFNGVPDGMGLRLIKNEED